VKYSRAVLKLSGEAFAGDDASGVVYEALDIFGPEIVRSRALGVELGIVVGGGNFVRGGRSVWQRIDRVTADRIGMVSTVVNGLLLGEWLANHGVSSRVLTAIEMGQTVEPYSCERAVAYLKEGCVVIFVGGTGCPYFSTDTAAALRAAELGAGVLVKATNVDGVFSADPKAALDAVKYDRLTYGEAIERDLRVMDHAALSLCRDNNIPIIVLDLRKEGSIARALMGEPVGTILREGE